ncbi:hypothetical protein K5I29_08040 [Flavobacterium agricola]|uniref:Uncharacterized protein n=1 Tax=Flavobacterium agricola TaxID=2870839 RepID=A0ABY6LVZ3_9FLAO|nr:hypothetical protein [Flavobacterium agricola]UYW00499.1 hypothetical protein K5I29_08040 [Flavobacterium agricola]
MSNLFKSNKYIYFILLHAILGLVVSSFLIVSKVLSILIVVVGVLYIIKSKDKNNEALFFAAYVCGIEIFLRMTGGAFFNEYGKYVISLFCLLGVLFHPVQISKLLFIFLFLLLIPSLFIGLLDSSYEINLRKSVIFNISGELCLLACCLYTFGKKIDFKQLINLVYVISLPIVSIVVYISTHTLFADNVYVSTTSNFASSGGFGPNQVSTILGLGTFCFFVLFILKKSIPYEKFLYLGLFIYTAYRGVVTFSRGGRYDLCPYNDSCFHWNFIYLY